MAVFDARQGQVLPQPVTNYYQGKALRAGIKAQEIENEQAPEKLKQEERRVKALEDQVVIRQKEFDERIKENERLIGAEATKRGAYDLWSGVSDINSRVQNKELSEDEALVEAKEFVGRYADSLPDQLKDKADAIRSYIEDNDGLTLGEWQAIGGEAKMAAGYYGFVSNQDPYTLGPGMQRRGPNNELLAENPITPRLNDRAMQAKSLVGKATNESIDKWIKTGEYSDLVLIEKGGKDTFKATERQAKAMSWLNQALTGNGLMEQYLASDMEIRWDEVAKYLTSIAEDSGPWTQQGMREFGLTQDELNFFDAVNLLVDPIVRQSTGAAVKAFEFAQWFNTLVPMSTDPTELAQKAFARSRVIGGLRLEAGNDGAEIVLEQHERSPMPDFVERIPNFEGKSVSEAQAEFDALPKGAVYIDVDGERATK